MADLNLFQHNSGVRPVVINNAGYDIRAYIRYINGAIDLMKRTTYSFKVKIEKLDKEERCMPIEPELYLKNAKDIRKAERAIELLFNENTKKVYSQNKNFFESKSLKIVDKNIEGNYFILATQEASKHEENAEVNNIINEKQFYLRPDTYQLEVQKRALNKLIDEPLAEHRPLLELFSNPSTSFWEQYPDNKSIDWKVLTDKSMDGCIEQRDFVNKAMQTNDFALLEGPPGSGKTTSIIELIIQLAAQGKRVLLCSATHAAIDNVIERVTGRYKNVCDQEIIPVRISANKSVVKENVRPYILSNLVKTYKNNIKSYLDCNNALASQKFLRDNITQSKTNQCIIEKVILESANLVAGTSIGILQHPDIKKNRSVAEFDVLIVDEASKVTFSDFIVPALQAKRWILVGDIKQLSPYVEGDYVSDNIHQLLGEKQQASIKSCFEINNVLAKTKNADCLKIYFVERNALFEYELIRSKNSDLFVKRLEDETVGSQDIVEINSADVLVCENTVKIKQFLGNHIYVKAIVFNQDPDFKLKFKLRQSYFHKKKQRVYTAYEDSWSEMIASRLDQQFSFRTAKGFEDISQELNLLIPDEELQNELGAIKRLVFPSVLEMLQVGVGMSGNQRTERVISNGFDPKYKASRFVSLSYQHRMHPQIAETSQKNFYDNNLLPANTVSTDRGWKYAPNEPAVIWVTDNYKSRDHKRIINPHEVDNMLTELSGFMAWAKNNPKLDHNGNPENYEVAVLSFYRNQEFELRKCIRKLSNQHRKISRFDKDNVLINLYTVDKFQGQEADLVLLGFTKYSKKAFYNSPNRLNVALTRARYKLILFGNKEYLKKSKLEALRYLSTAFERKIKYKNDSYRKRNTSKSIRA